MIDLGQHAVFIVGAYGGVALGVAGLIAYTMFDRAQIAKRLARLNAKGIRRRSSGAAR